MPEIAVFDGGGIGRRQAESVAAAEAHPAFPGVGAVPIKRRTDVHTSEIG